MNTNRRRALALTAALGISVAAAPAAHAFCGFYVSPGEQKLTNNATMTVLMREGMRTVLSMQNNYKGPPSDFAMVVPVPVVLQKENVRTLPREVFDRVDLMASPRLVEYWEQNPCPEEHAKLQRAQEAVAAAPSPMAAATASPAADLGVRVEAEFTVGEYEVVVLSARDSGGLDTWLHQNNYKIPDGAEPLLRPYVAKGMKFFVAKVNAAKVRFENGQAVLSPLRFHYDADDFSLPVRLGLLNSDGKQELVVHILARNKRYEVANYPNVFIPTNLDVAEEARERFGQVYAALFDATMEKHPGAVVTEYAWDASTCDPCPGPNLGPNDMLTLGADVLVSPPANLPNDPDLHAVVSLTDVKGTGTFTASAREIVESDLPTFTRCYTNELARVAAPKGTLKIALSLDAKGKTTEFSSSVTGSIPSSLATCAEPRWRNGYFSVRRDQPGKLEFTVKFDVEKGAPGSGWWRPPPPNTWGFTLTRLHTRYAKETLGQDLIFREAQPVIGGREEYNVAEQDHGAKPASMNNFQARYAIRHPWKGPITCSNPRRGVWGGPPGGGWPGAPRAASKIAYVPRGGVSLASMVKQAVPDLGLAGQPAGTADSTSARGACACSTQDNGGPLLPCTLAAFAALLLNERRRRRS
jgi:hypothetical protein